jgi:hypothetical protein
LKKKVLFVVNAHHRLESEICNLYQLHQTTEEDFHFLTRYLSGQNSHAVFSSEMRYSNLSDLSFFPSSTLSKWYEWAIEEIEGDRALGRFIDFNVPWSIHKPPTMLSLQNSVNRILNILMAENSFEYIGLGHPDNWLGILVGRIAEDLNIPTGFAYEMHLNSQFYFISHGHSGNNIEITQEDFSRCFSSVKSIPEISNFRSGNAAINKAKSDYSILDMAIKVIKTEIRSVQDFISGKIMGKDKFEYAFIWTPVFSRIRVITNWLSRPIKRSVLTRYENQGYVHFKSTSKKRCVLFLSSAPEAQGLVYARKYQNDLNFLLKLREKLGDDYDFYVKEHPVQKLEFRNIKFLRLLRENSSGFLPSGLNITNQYRESDVFASLNGSITIECSAIPIPVILGSDTSWLKWLYNSIVLHEIGPISELDELKKRLQNDRDRHYALNINCVFEKWKRKGILIGANSDIKAQIKSARRALEGEFRN